MRAQHIAALSRFLAVFTMPKTSTTGQKQNGKNSNEQLHKERYAFYRNFGLCDWINHNVYMEKLLRGPIGQEN